MAENFYNEDLEISEVDLIKLKHTSLAHIERSLWKEMKLNDAYINFALDPMVEGIIAKFTNRIWCHEEDVYEFRWFKSWWQELRSKIFPKWYLNRFPCKFEIKERVKALSTYPTLRLADGSHNSVIHFNRI